MQFNQLSKLGRNQKVVKRKGNNEYGKD